MKWMGISKDTHKHRKFRQNLSFQRWMRHSAQNAMIYILGDNGGNEKVKGGRFWTILCNKCKGEALS